MFKKVYVEITNACNLNCKFCIKNSRPIKYISIDEFKDTLNKLKGYTSYLYFHVLGEPLLHPDINELINIASKNFKINLTTNGYLIKKIENNENIRQINISLQSFDEKYQKSFDNYMNDIINTINILKKNTIICLRLWVKSDYSNKIINYLNNYYHKDIKESTKLEDNVYFETEEEFIWPSLDNNFTLENGSCKGTIDHIGILSDGTVVPCCLDTKGIINLGNIHENTLESILNSKVFNEIKEGFKENKKIHPLCQKCNFYSLRKNK